MKRVHTRHGGLKMLKPLVIPAPNVPPNSAHRPPYHRKNRLIDGKAVLIAVGLLVAFAVGIVALFATSKPARAHPTATPGAYSTDAPPDDGIMGKKPAIDKVQER